MGLARRSLSLILTGPGYKILEAAEREHHQADRLQVGQEENQGPHDQGRGRLKQGISPSP